MQSLIIRWFLALVILSICVVGADSEAAIPHHQSKMSFLDNGVIKVGVDLNLGGAITYLSLADREQNLVNSFDLGREIQVSYYSGPVPFKVPGHKMKSEWSFIGWNPIQVGDAFGNPSKVLESINDGKIIYVKCRPMQWPLDNVPGECTYECWLTLEGNVVHARVRLVNDRVDKKQYAGRNQELPAVYTNGPWYRLMSYTGDRPFFGDAISRIQKHGGRDPWSHWTATESWAALVDDNNFGLGVYSPTTCTFSGGFNGKPGKGGPGDDPTGYISPNAVEVLDWNIEHSYRYDLIVGNLSQIRSYVYGHAVKPNPPFYSFEKDRAGWSFVNAVDTGWPIKGELNVRLERAKAQLIGPVGFWHAEAAGTLVIQAALHSASNGAQLFWHGPHNSFSQNRSLGFAMNNDGQYHTCRVDLTRSPQWKGAISQIKFQPVDKGAAGDWIRIRSIGLVK